MCNFIIFYVRMSRMVADEFVDLGIIDYKLDLCFGIQITIIYQ